MDDVSRAAELERLRAVLVEKLEGAEGSGAAAVVRELRAVMAELGRLAGPGEGSVLDRFQGRGDELASRRGAGSARRQPAKSRRGKQAK